MGLLQVSDEAAITEAVDAVIHENAKAVADYRKGNDRALGALVGAVRNKLGSGADLIAANRILLERLKGSPVRKLLEIPDLGSIAAENDRNLLSYFITTPSFEALNDQRA